MMKPEHAAAARGDGRALSPERILAGLGGPAEARRFLAAIVSSSDDAIIGKTLDGVITSWNKGAERIYGYAAEEVVGRPIAILVPPDHPDELSAIFARLRRGERIEHYETERVRKDGSRVPISLTISPIEDEAGRLVGASAVARDISERRRAEEELRARNRALETLVRTNAAIAAELDLERLVQLVTDAGVELTRARFGAFFYNMTDARGESYQLYTLAGAPREAFSRFPMPRNTAVFSPTFGGEGVVRSADITADPRYGRNRPYHGMPEGHLPVRSYLAVPVISRSGEVLGGLFFGHPEPGVFTALAERLITGVAAQAAIAIDNARLYRAVQSELAERERAEAALTASETLSRRRLAELQAIYATAPVGLCFTDTHHRYVSVNDRMAALNGVAVEAHLGRTVREVLPAPLAATAEALRQGVVDTGEPVLDVELRGATAAEPDAERCWLASYYPVRGADGAVQGVNAVVQDITERKRTEERQRLLLAELSHRVKNTLAVVQAVAAQTGARAATVPEFLKAFEGRLSALAAVHGLLTASRWEGATLVDLAHEALAPYLVEDGRVRLEVAGITLKPAAAATFALALHELATNAGKYGALSAAGGRVVLSARVEQDGRDGAELRVLWEERGGPPVRPPERTGFGTVLLRQAVEYQHDGRVELDWRQEGLICRLSLPLHEVVAPPAGRGGDRDAGPGSSPHRPTAA